MVWGASSLCRWSVFRPGGCLGDANTGHSCRPWRPLSRRVPAFAGHACSLGQVFYALCFQFARLERLQAPFIYMHTDLAAQTGGKDSCPRPPHPVIFRPKVSRRVMNSTIRLHFAPVFERLLDGRWFSVVRVCVCGGGARLGAYRFPPPGFHTCSIHPLICRARACYTSSALCVSCSYDMMNPFAFVCASLAGCFWRLSHSVQRVSVARRKFVPCRPSPVRLAARRASRYLQTNCSVYSILPFQFRDPLRACQCCIAKRRCCVTNSRGRPHTVNALRHAHHVLSPLWCGSAPV
jgi:hypothetical protein